MKVSKGVVDQLAQVTTATLSTLMLKDHGLANTCIRNVRLVNEDGKGMAGPAYTMRYLPGREDLLPEQWLNHLNNLMRVSVESMPAGVIVVMDSSVHDDVGLLGGNLLARMICRGGAAHDGLYPPDEQSTAQYHAWVKAGRPADRLIV